MSEEPLTPDDAEDSLEARLARLERRERALREFVVPAYWNLLDQLAGIGPRTDPVACLACGHERPPAAFGVRLDSCVFDGGRLERLECPDCGCVFGPLKYLRLPEAIVAADYRLLYTHYQEGDSTEAEIRAFEMLDPEPGQLYLNWGSGGWSRSVQILRDRGFDVWGFEPNAQGDEPFVVRTRGEVSARFHGIFSNNVIEHFVSPQAQFRDFHDILAPGGRMAHASPCYQWSYAFTRFHVFFPMGRAAEALAARTGFQVGRREEDGEFRAVRFDRIGD